MEHLLFEKGSAVSAQASARAAQAAQKALRHLFGTVQSLKSTPGAAQSRAAVGRLGVALTGAAKHPQNQQVVQPLLEKTFGGPRAGELMRQYGFQSALGVPQAATTQTAIRGVDQAGRWVGRSVQKPDSVLGPMREQLRSAGAFAARGRPHVGQL